jgi:hypothetical protein
MLNRVIRKVRKLKDKIDALKYLSIDKNSSLSFHPEVLLIVARYNENVDWCSTLDIPYVIYNKGKDVLSNNLTSVKLRNVGREGHTILHFIISHYHELPERIIFTQGDPFPHAPDFIESVSNFKNHLPVQPLSLRYLSAKDPKLKGRKEFDGGIPNEQVLQQHTKRHAGVPYYVEELDGGFNVVKPYAYADPGIQCLRFVKENNLKSFSKLCRQFGLNVPEICYFSYAGIFSVDKKQILRNSLETYKKLIRFLLEDPDHGFLLERMWLTIFGYQPKE